jgi:hypothetical protein
VWKRVIGGAISRPGAEHRSAIRRHDIKSMPRGRCIALQAIVETAANRNYASNRHFDLVTALAPFDDRWKWGSEIASIRIVGELTRYRCVVENGAMRPAASRAVPPRRGFCRVASDTARMLLLIHRPCFIDSTSNKPLRGIENDDVGRTAWGGGSS